ncbi:DUF4301 family protein [Winogradskyella sp. 3972H.M.0a.05]|uniref:DUF4301 family protein n=1 Tax=Winogradskyella sp. 3972H.M.0a.05 TaxID=2950277 RepID=UPI003391647F
MTFNENDLKQIEKKGITLQDVNRQIQLFEKGLPFVNLKEAATLSDGIVKIEKDKEQAFIDLFENKRPNLSITKFVPASGAATRMFKFLFSFLKKYKPNNGTINSYINKNKANDMSLFLVGMEKLPFYDKVLQKTRDQHSDYEDYSNDKRIMAFITTMLDIDKLNFSFYPKGLLPFHKYKDHVATAFEEHLFEAALYGSSNQEANLHFTISEQHNHIFDEEFKRIEEIVEEKTNTKFNISFSYQKQSTDTIAVTADNEPFRNSDGSLLFRPSGHGALLENLNDLDADIAFIKNIDNVVVYKYEQDVAYYKKLLGGILLELQSQAFEYLELLDSGSVDEEKIIEIAEFLTQKLNVDLSEEFEKYATKYQIEYLHDKLNRPLRVCGMVKNEGEPGGGPFWVKDERGYTSLQIVESAQINKKNKLQKAILVNSTHFNPVDLVCGLKNYKGKSFDLKKFVDPKTAFISMKTKTGKDIKALELPGLWNGSMAYWNTIFVEVPLVTFNPVKTVNDLLKAQHQIT